MRFAGLVLILLAPGGCRSPDAPPAAPVTPEVGRQTKEAAAAKSAGCLSCHQMAEHRAGPGIADDPTMHVADVRLGCTDCHGGNASAVRPETLPNRAPYSEGYRQIQRLAHLHPRFPAEWPASGNPVGSFTLLNREDPQFVRFVNPGDLRAAPAACGACHPRELDSVRRSLMTTSAMFWEAATYNNGSIPEKQSRFGESYSPSGEPQRLQGVVDWDASGHRSVRWPTKDELARGVLPTLGPLPRWNVAQPGNVLRAFERGGRTSRADPSDVGLPNTGEPAGKPDMKLGDRGFGTELRFDPVLLNLQKTRLNDPHLSFLGTNDHPGDYRSSGCSACHVIYANDRTETHSGPYAKQGNRGHNAGADPTIPKDSSGHPIVHRFTNSIPSSQCMTCHHHQPNAFVNSFFGFQLWDYETDGRAMWPPKQQEPSEEQRARRLASNPEEAAVRGKWSDPEFLANLTDLNPTLGQTQFADYHGHGWVFRAVYKRDRKGNLLDRDDKIVPFDDPARWTKAVHLKDIHAERGMHCVDCHMRQDSHGDGRLYGESPNAIEITCIDCHGTVRKRFGEAQGTSGPAARPGRPLTEMKTPWGEPRFEWRGDEMAPLQRSVMYPDKSWEIPQVQDLVTNDPSRTRQDGRPWFNPAAARAKTMRKDGVSWGALPASDAELAHRSNDMACFTCHTSWTTSCFGCHLPMRANARRPMLHNEGDWSRNWTTYNPQVVRDDIFMLGREGTVKGGKIAPVRSSSAVLISSQNAQREWIYEQQPPVSAPGLSSQAFNPHFPHTVRTRETKRCSDCHVSEAGDNNAWLAQVFLQGTQFVNFMGRYCYVAEGQTGLEAVVVAEREEPQAVLGSELHHLAYPADFTRFVESGRKLDQAELHSSNEVRSLQLRGEYLYAACGSDGFRVYDVANIDNKGYSQKIVTAPVSPLGQNTRVSTRNATAVALPTTMPVHDRSGLLPEAFWEENREEKLHPLYRYAYVADSEEGLILVDVSCLADGNPRNNFLSRALTWNPGGVLRGAANLVVAGTRAYVCASGGLRVVGLDDPLKPSLLASLGAPQIVHPRAVAIQFRYAFVLDEEGLKVLDVTFPEKPQLRASVPLGLGMDLYVARTYAYVAAGSRGLAIIDVERPEHPGEPRFYNFGGRLDDAQSVRVASTNASLFAYVADGANGLRVLQLTSPESVPGHDGFSPEPVPTLIATYRTEGRAIALSKPLDRDRAVDESGNQISVFGRLGSRPLNYEETRRMYVRDGKLWTVSDRPKSGPLK